MNLSSFLIALLLFLPLQITKCKNENLNVNNILDEYDAIELSDDLNRVDVDFDHDLNDISDEASSNYISDLFRSLLNHGNDHGMVQNIRRILRQVMKSKKLPRFKPKNVQLRPFYEEAKRQNALKRPAFTWSPHSERYLLMICSYGQVSNRIGCIRQHLLLSGLLNRTLLIPFATSEVVRKYDRRLYFNLDHVRLCFGTNSVMTTSEYRNRFGIRPRVDKIMCLGHKGCVWRENKELLNTVDFSRMPLPIRLGLGRNPNLNQIMNAFLNVDDKILMTGDLFYFRPYQPLDLITGGDIPFVRSAACPDALAVAPHEAITQAGELYIREVLKGARFVGMHMRRGDFAQYCKSFVGGCYFSIEQMVDCFLEKVKDVKISKIFLATNAQRAEVARFKRLLKEKDSRRFKVYQLPPHLSTKDEVWSKPISERVLQYYGVVFATLDKVICARASIFFGSPHSTFSSDIQRMRYGLNTSQPRDDFICKD